MRIDDLIVFGRTAPEESKKYGQSVCMAGYSQELRQLMRLYPMSIRSNIKARCVISAEIERINYIVAGIGINANQDLEDFPEELQQKATSLKICTSKEIDRNKLLRFIIEELEKMYITYVEKGFAEILSIWEKHNITLGKRVKAVTFDSEINGLAEKIDEQGYLVIKDDQGKEHKVVAGDVSLRREDGSYI